MELRRRRGPRQPCQNDQMAKCTGAQIQTCFAAASPSPTKRSRRPLHGISARASFSCRGQCGIFLTVPRAVVTCHKERLAGGGVLGRASSVAVVSFGLAAGAATVVWLGFRSDTTLVRWSAIGGVVTAGVGVVALVVALVPLWSRNSDGRPNGESDDRSASQAPRIKIRQTARGNDGPTYIQGTGIQVNSSPGEKR
jgi:hypothetical protein